MNVLYFVLIGPERWGEVSQHCDGQEQSPINIVTKKAQIDRTLAQFELTEYNHIFNSAIKNTGYTGNIWHLLLKRQYNPLMNKLCDLQMF